MPHVTLERNGIKVEGDLSVADIKDLMGIAPTNGHHDLPSKKQPPLPPVQDAASSEHDAIEPYDQFLREISAPGRQFLELLKENPDGIDAQAVAVALQLPSRASIGGLTGGGLARVAKRTGIKLPNVYRKEITSPHGVRTVMFYPGKLLMNGKPAV
jgi:hypothetical protein